MSFHPGYCLQRCVGETEANTLYCGGLKDDVNTAFKMVGLLVSPAPTKISFAAQFQTDTVKRCSN